MNQGKMPLKAETKNAMSKWDKKIEKIIRHCSWSVDVTAPLTKKKKSERQLEQESAGRMLQRATQRKAGVSQLQGQVGQTDDCENYGGQHVFLRDEGTQCLH
jgi:hypothetical protein